MRINEKIQKIKPSGIREFFDVVATRPDALSLGVGEPDFPTPWNVRSDAIKSIQKGQTAYTSNKGLLELRSEVADYMKVRFDLSYDPEDEILITVGASEAIDLALRVILNPGDTALVPYPCYVSYEPVIIMAGGEPVAVTCTAEENFVLSAESLEKAILSAPSIPKVLIMAYPNNPTGVTMNASQLSAIAKVLIKYDIIVISDEIYAELSYENKHVSIASLDGMAERTVVVNGFSKAFSMTGWRMGFVCAPIMLSKAMLKLHQYTALCAPTTSQYAGLSALKSGKADNYAVVTEMKEEYDRRRRFIVESMRNMGLECSMPSGAFYAFPSVKSTGMDGQTFARRLLDEENVAVVPGDAFGEFAKYHIRVSYASSLRNLREAVKRMERFIKKNS